MKLRPGVLWGAALDDVFAYCAEQQCALPAVNVIGSHSLVAALAAAKQAASPIVVQFSHGGAQFFAGKGLDNKTHRASVYGAVAGAECARVLAEAHGVSVVLHTDHAARGLLPWIDGLLERSEERFKTSGAPLFSSHMLDLSEESLGENLETCKHYLTRMARMKMLLEIELGVTGGEEDGVDNSGVDNAKLYTQPEDVLQAYDTLKAVGSFTVAASFGNTHGVYKPGNVQLRPVILKNSQERVSAERGGGKQPLKFVFHGGSGSLPEEIREAVGYGVVKMNIDTDTQWAFTQPVKQYMDKNDAYLQGQLGNPEGPDKPNKKQIDPRAWLYPGEKGMTARLVQAFADLGCNGKFSY